MNLEEVISQITELQSRVLFQDDTIQKLDDVVIRQSQALEALTQRLAELERQLESERFEREQTQALGDEKPPHY